MTGIVEVEIGTLKVGMTLRSEFTRVFKAAEDAGATITYTEHRGLFTTTYMNLCISGTDSIVSWVEGFISDVYAAYGYEL